mmetsp:Transcript_45044/g.104348  ORF Transcript_45044/g.104348 Transcript_45044/m.104348 type:complete len:114 (+) Transcript_45044:60-401(+)
MGCSSSVQQENYTTLSRTSSMRSSSAGGTTSSRDREGRSISAISNREREREWKAMWNSPTAVHKKEAGPFTHESGTSSEGPQEGLEIFRHLVNSNPLVFEKYILDSRLRTFRE